MRAIKKNIAWIMLIMLFAVGCSSIEKAESLYRQGEKQEALEMAISLLDDDSPKVRLRAVKLVGSIGGPQAGPALHERIVETDARVLREVVRNLGKVKYEPAIEDLADMTTESNSDMLRALADAFRGYGKPAIDVIVSRYDSSNQSGIRAAYKELLIAVGPEIADSISKLLKGRSFFENRDTFEILRQIKNPRVATLMMPYLADEEVASKVSHCFNNLFCNFLISKIRHHQCGNTGIFDLAQYFKCVSILKERTPLEKFTYGISNFRSDSNQQFLVSGTNPTLI